MNVKLVTTPQIFNHVHIYISDTENVLLTGKDNTEKIPLNNGIFLG